MNCWKDGLANVDIRVHSPEDRSMAFMILVDLKKVEIGSNRAGRHVGEVDQERRGVVV
jgi:hypothetical protein